MVMIKILSESGRATKCHVTIVKLQRLSMCYFRCDVSTESEIGIDNARFY